MLCLSASGGGRASARAHQGTAEAFRRDTLGCRLRPGPSLVSGDKDTFPEDGDDQDPHASFGIGTECFAIAATGKVA